MAIQGKPVPREFREDVELNRTQRDIIAKWQSLSGYEQDLILPELIVNMQHWQIWGTGKSRIWYWLTQLFNRVGLKLPQEG